MNLDEAYVDTRDRYLRLVRGVDPDQLATTVPTCPAWTVQDLTAHLTSVCALFPDIGHPLQEDGVLDVDTTDPARAKRMNDATEQEVVLRRGRDLERVISEWDEILPRGLRVLAGAEPLPDGAPPAVKFAVVGDMCIHLHDARGALGLPGDRTIPSATIVYESWLTLLGRRLPAAGLPALRVLDRVVGDGEPAAVIDADWYEVMRALSGRRSPDQMRAMFVKGEPDLYLPRLCTFVPPEHPIIE
ncbi:MAG: maleylpyruvate isomerase family mycothiol-dependent enzyme [Acidimicrobiales bacterium]